MFMKVEIGEPLQVRRQISSACTKSLKFSKFSGGNTPGPLSTEDLLLSPWRREKWGSGATEKHTKNSAHHDVVYTLIFVFFVV